MKVELTKVSDGVEDHDRLEVKCSLDEALSSRRGTFPRPRPQKQGD